MRGFYYSACSLCYKTIAQFHQKCLLMRDCLLFRRLLLPESTVTLFCWSTETIFSTNWQGLCTNWIGIRGWYIVHAAPQKEINGFCKILFKEASAYYAIIIKSSLDGKTYILYVGHRYRSIAHTIINYSIHWNSDRISRQNLKENWSVYFSNFFCIFLNPNNFFQFEF